MFIPNFFPVQALLTMNVVSILCSPVNILYFIILYLHILINLAIKIYFTLICENNLSLKLVFCYINKSRNYFLHIKKKIYQFFKNKQQIQIFRKQYYH